MRILHILGLVLLLFASPAAAKDAGAWIVAQKSGEVRVFRNGAQQASVQVRSQLAPGDLIATGATGRAMLTNGDDYVIVAPGSRLVLPKDQQQTGFTRLVQQVGTMLYKVKHTGIPHFSVNTPMLAAVVKGTSFTIVVDQDRAAVQVTDGVVEVSSATGQARRLVERGATVYVGRERPNEIIELKASADLPASTSSDAGAVRIESSGDVSLSTISDLTGGLVHEVPTAPVVTAVVTQVVTAQPAAQPVAVADTAASTPGTGTPAVAVTPAATTPAVSVTPVTIAPVEVTSVTTPAVSVTPTSISTTPVATPAITTPTLATPTVTTTVATVAPVTVTAVTVPTVTVDPVVVTPTAVTTPTVTVPEVTTPTVTTPTVTTPIVTVPAVTVPTVTVPTVTVPSVTVPNVLGGLLGGSGGSGGGGTGP